MRSIFHSRLHDVAIAQEKAAKWLKTIFFVKIKHYKGGDFSVRSSARISF